MKESDEYAIDCESQPAVAVLRGVLRLQSTEAYDRLFQVLEQKIRNSGGPYALDLRDVILMNSSGIRALAGLVLTAKAAGVPLVLRLRASVPWQRKTVSSLKLLYASLEVNED